MSAATNRAPPPGEVSALILAAGMGERMGGQPKAFIRVGAATLLERVVALVRPFADEVIAGLPAADIARGRALLAGHDATVATGGASRQETVSRLLARATRRYVLIHEVARPFARPELFTAVLAAARVHGTATLFVPASRRNALVLRKDDWFGAPLARDDVIALQNPQAYGRDMLLEAERAAGEEGWAETSTANLVARAGYRVRLVPGDPDNLKLTYPEDWDAALARLANS